MVITWSVYQSVFVYEKNCKLSRHELAIEIEMLYQLAQWNDQVEIDSNIILADSAIDQNRIYRRMKNSNMGEYNKK